MTIVLVADDFDGFFREVHGQRPFGWQSDLVRQVVEHGCWPRLVDVPTGLGKTALLDVAVFVLALTAGSPGPARLGRRRVFFVVDRRIVVDQAHERAQGIAAALAAPMGPQCEAVASLLRGLHRSPRPEQPPLEVVRMRGGLTWSADWLERPDLPGIVTGTVDQVGSRLLFRGYGVSPGRRPLDAAMVGNDALILVDEAHLAEAMTQTLSSAREIERHVPTALSAPDVVALTATHAPSGGRDRPASDQRWTYELDVDAHDTVREPVAARRLHAPKALGLCESSRTRVVGDLAEAAAGRAAESGARVLVVCNTVDRARAVHRQIAQILDPATGLDLLIGRTRSIDADVVRGRLAQFLSERDRGSIDCAILVATQTVEVGVDLDATALVTECPSWDALVQRIGRVNRLGLLASPAPVLVVHDGVIDGPVYGASRDRTWEFLRAVSDQTTDDAGVDVSPLACRSLSLRVPPGVYRSGAATPVLLRPVLDAWTRTNPQPVNDPPLQSYLHGRETSSPTVSVAWRDGLVFPPEGWPEDLASSRQRRSLVEVGVAVAASVVDAVPLVSEELVEVPLGAFRRWLTGEDALPLADLDSAWDDEFDFDPAAVQPRLALRRTAGSDDAGGWAWVGARELRPGDVIVVPSERGGLDAYGWAPDSTEAVVDVAELAALRRGRAVIRLDGPGSLHRWGIDLAALEVARAIEDDPVVPPGGTASDAVLVLASTLSQVDVSTLPAPWRAADVSRLSQLLAATGRAQLVTEADSVQIAGEPTPGVRIVRGSPRPGDTRAARDELDDVSIDGSVHLEAAVELDVHQQQVGDRARDMADALGLPQELVRAVVDAARWHDVGKCDPRFQAMLHDGDAYAALVAERLLAKSGMPPGDSVRRQRAQARSGLPRGARHEAWSGALVGAHLASLTSYEADPDLVVHLVASHHGRARPLLPPVVDHAEHALSATIDGTTVSADLPRTVCLDDADRFGRLNARYGRWGLALLESIVRCADMTVSSEGS